MQNVKHLFLSMTLFFFAIFMSACQSKQKLLLLNWGEYISDEVITAFEKETGYEVVVSLADSNELFYSKIKSGTTVYDLVVPSDYMIEKMIQKDQLHEIDISKLKNHPQNNTQIHFMEGAIGIQNDMFNGMGSNYLNYAVPYFWGTFGLMYNKNIPGLEEAVKTYEWTAFYEHNYLPANTKVGMYNTPRYVYATTMFYQNLSPNIISDELLTNAENILSKVKFNEWGFDTLKKNIVAGNLDLAFVYTGDFLDMLYTALDDGQSLEDIPFDIHIPTQTIAFMDALVIPKNARHKDIAYEFIDFMLDPNHAYQNASVVGYATPILESYQAIISHLNDEDDWLNAWAYANKKYYPLPNEGDDRKYQGTPLSNFDQVWLDKINLMINNVKTKS